MPGRRNVNENVDCKVYVGNLGERPPLKEDLQYEFSYYGPLVDVWIARSPPGFAYIEFEEPDDAVAACEGLDGKLFEGRKLRVEMARHSGPRSRGGGRRSRSRSRDRSRDRDSRRERKRRSRSRSQSRSVSRSRSRSNSNDNSRSDSKKENKRESDDRRSGDNDRRRR